MSDYVPIRKRKKPRIVLYSHDTLGYGHFRRNILIADSLRKIAQEPDILMLAGMREAGRFDLPQGTDLITLPAYSKDADGGYSARHLALDLCDLARLRAETILAAVKAFRPDILIIDNVPRGAQNELEPTLRHIKETGGTRVILGLRDIIDDPEKVRLQWSLQRNLTAVEDWFDEVWIYGSAGFYDLVDEYAMGPSFSKKTRFTGYLSRNMAVDPANSLRIRDAILGEDTRPYILAMVGGGRDGIALCESFARAELPSGRRGILVMGSQMPASEAARILKLGEGNPDLTVLGFVSETMALIDGAEKVVTMGGYNSVCEILSHRKQALIVPRVEPRAEQLIRAGHLARAGLVDMLHPTDLSPQALGQWMAKPVPTAPPDNPITMNGLENIALFAAETLSRPACLRIGHQTE